MKKITLILLILISLSTYISAEKWSFVVYGDNRPSYSEQPYMHYKIVEKIDTKGPEFIVSTGDIIMGRTENLEELREQYIEFEEVIEPIKDIPFYVAPGNHEDIYTENAHDEFIKRYNKTYMSIVKENTLVILLDSEEIGKKHKIVGEQLEWLEQELEKYSDLDHKFVFLHQPLYPQLSHIGNSLDKYPEARDNLAMLLKNHDVDMVFAGHVHIFNQLRKDNLNQIITGGGGAPLYAPEDQGGYYHFVNVIIEDDKVEYQVIRAESEVDKAYEYLEEGQLEDAKFYARKAREYLPNHPEPHTISLLIAEEEGNKEDFAKYFTNLSKALGGDFEADKRLGYEYYYQKSYDKAEKQFEQALKIKEEKAILYNLGKINLKQKEYKTALNYYNKALEKIEDKRWREYILKKIDEIKEKM